MIIRYAEEIDLASVARFNGRLKAAGRTEEMLLSPELPGESKYRPEGFPIYRRMIIAEDGQEVRAAMLLCHHNVFVNGQKLDFCWTKLPISEGIIDKRYALAIVRLMKKALDDNPFLMGIGGGTYESDGFQFFVKLKWKYRPIPFFFYPVRAGRVMRELRYFDRSAGLRFGARLGAYSGIGAGVSGLLNLQRKASPLFLRDLAGYEHSVVDHFSDWADKVFYDSLPDYQFAVRSDATSLNIVYPPDDQRYTRIKVTKKDTKRDAGWIVVATKQMDNNHYFGNLKVGTLVDGFGLSKDAPALVFAGINYLAGAGVDIIVANFSHEAWVKACRLSGMLTGPSNYQIFVSPKGPPVFEESCPLDKMHLARGHSDGMDNLV